MNEPARPAAARPVLSFRFLVHTPTRSRLGPGRAICVCVSPAPLYSARPCNRLPLRVPRVSIDPRGNPARAGLEPDASPRDTLTRATLPAAPPQALRAIPHGSLDTPVMLRPSPHSFSPSGWSGECIAASAARRPGDPATDPHSGTRDSLPSHSRLRRERLRRERLRRERLRRNQCPARPFGSSAECTFPSPPFRFCSLCFSALPAKSTS